MKYILAIDQGTSSSRAIIYDENGQIMAVSQYPLPTRYPQAGWVEQDAEAIWSTVLQAIRDVCQQVEASHIIACGITNQRETVIAWDRKTGEVLSPAIVWQDRRTQAVCDQMQEYQSLIQGKTGLRVDPYFSASKMRWLLAQHPQWNRQHLAIATVDCYLLWRLTGGKVYKTDVTNASRTQLFNIHQLTWDSDLCDLWQIPMEILPEVRATDSHFGNIDQSWSGFTCPITAMAGDQQAALFGQACLEAGQMKATFGTGAFMLLNTGAKPAQSSHGLISTLAWQLQGQICYGLEGSIYQAGTTIKWLRDEMGLIQSAAETASLAASLPSNEGVYLVSSFNGLGAPHWLPQAGAFIEGLSRQSTRAHIARAALEGVAYQTRDVLEAMQADTGKLVKTCRVDGGMADNPWFLQFLADQCHFKVEKPRATEATATGVALMAAIGVGLFTDQKAATTWWTLDQAYEPSSDRETYNSFYRRWQALLKLRKCT